MSRSHADHDCDIAVEQERRRNAKAEYELNEIFDVPLLAKKARLAFEQAKIEGFSGPAGDAYFRAEDEFQRAMLNDREKTQELAQVAS